MTPALSGERISGGPREIGSYFETDDRALPAGTLQTVPPGIERADAYLETGRQALAVIVGDLKRQGIGNVFVPGYLCESMLRPFLLAGGITLSYLPVDPYLQIDLDRLSDLGSTVVADNSAVLMTRYFGQPRDPGYVAHIERLQGCGITVIEDLTHALFDPEPSSARYTFASLRKLLPLSSGAVVSGTSMLPEDLTERAGLHGMRWGHMDSKRAYVAGRHENRDFYKGLMFTDQELEADDEPRAMDARSKDALTRFDYEDIVLSRRNNYEELVRELTGIPGIAVVNRHAEVPTHLVVETRADLGLRGHLAREGIYCPVHWPKPSAVPASAAWAKEHFSIPVDQRYSADDMARVAAVIREFLNL